MLITKTQSQKNNLKSIVDIKTKKSLLEFNLKGFL